MASNSLAGMSGSIWGSIRTLVGSKTDAAFTLKGVSCCSL